MLLEYLSLSAFYRGLQHSSGVLESSGMKVSFRGKTCLLQTLAVLRRLTVCVYLKELFFLAISNYRTFKLALFISTSSLPPYLLWTET